MEPKLVRFLSCESPERYIWDEYLYFENESTAKRILKEKYAQLGVDSPERAAFRNVESLIYYIKQARDIFQTVKHSSLWVQPLLLYYGMMSLLKALLLTLDTNYPQNTSVLRHGLSTRKRKKEPFQFFQDEIRIQKEGLFPLVVQLLNEQVSSGDTYTAQELLGFIPEVQTGYRRLFHKPTLLPIQLATEDEVKHDEKGMLFWIGEEVLDQLHLTSHSLVEKLNRHPSQAVFALNETSETKGRLALCWQHPDVDHVLHWSKGFDHPLFYENSKGDYYLWISNNRPLMPVSELLAQYMLLFSLSMLCRYEPPIWGEMMMGNASEEIILVQQLISVVQRKFPQLILHALRDEKWIIHLH